MQVANFEISLDGSELGYMRQSFPDFSYLDQFLSGSEPRILYFCHRIEKSEWIRNPDLLVASDTLRRLNVRMKKLEEEPKNKSLEQDIKKEVNSLQYKKQSDPYGLFNDGDAFELPGNPTMRDEFSLYYIRLPWNTIRLQANLNDINRGYFICFGFSPINNELYYAGPDFVPNRDELEIEERLKGIPEGRGLPDDVLQTLANCGPSSFAAYMDLSCTEVIKKAHTWREKNYISLTPMQELFEAFGAPHENIKIKDEPLLPSKAFCDIPAGLGFIQFKGPRGKHDGWTGWSQAYSHTHWIAYDQGLVYDFNIRHEDGTLGDWIPEKEWQQYIIPMLMPEKGIGYYVKNIFIPDI